jgi:hypothetical protein
MMRTCTTPRPTMMASQPVSRRKLTALAAVVTSPLPTTGMRSVRFASPISSHAASLQGEG